MQQNSSLLVHFSLIDPSPYSIQLLYCQPLSPIYALFIERHPFQFIMTLPEAHLEPSGMPVVEWFCEDSGFWLLTVFANQLHPGFSTGF